MEETPTGQHIEEDVKEDMSQMFQRAIDAGLPPGQHDELRYIVLEYSEIFRNKMGSDPPAAMHPMIIRLKPNSKSFRAKNSRHSPPLQLAFMSNKVAYIEALGHVSRNPNSEWASVPLT